MTGLMSELMTGWMNWWEGVSPYWFAVTVYLTGSVIVLWLWLSIVRVLPRPLGGLSWLLVLTLLMTPTVTEGVNASLAPAVVGLLIGVFTKNPVLALYSLLPMLLVFGVGCLAGFIWQRVQMAHAAALAESARIAPAHPVPASDSVLPK